ncbi:MAG: hypothetical protein ACFFA6_02945 [Promethearchaeota archaeon]
MKKKIKTKSILLTFAVILLYSFSTINDSVAQGESITITGHGCTMCNVEENNYFVDWIYTGNIPNVSIYFYDLSMTTIEYIIIENITNLGTYEWSMPIDHPLDGDYYLVVCDSNNHSIQDSVLRTVYPIQEFHKPSRDIQGYPILLIGAIIGIMSVIVAVSLTKKLRMRQ